MKTDECILIRCKDCSRGDICISNCSFDAITHINDLLMIDKKKCLDCGCYQEDSCDQKKIPYCMMSCPELDTLCITLGEYLEEKRTQTAAALNFIQY